MPGRRGRTPAARRKDALPMTFTSLGFLLFFPAVCLLYYLLPAPARPAWLLAASYWFYACADWRGPLLLLAATAVSYGCGRALGALRSPRARRAVLVAAAVGFVGVLALFKYAGFALESLAALLHLAGIGVVSVGHCNPAVNAAVKEQVDKLVHVGNYFYIEHRGELCTYLVYVVDDAVAGICSYYDVGGERQLINIAVAEKYRRRGIGSALLRRMLADGSCASLEVETGNTEAIRLYEKMGFKKAGIRRHFYGRADAYIMLRD